MADYSSSQINEPQLGESGAGSECGVWFMQMTMAISRGRTVICPYKRV